MPFLLTGRTAGTAVLILSTVPLASCGSGPKLYPVSGKLYYGEQPAEGATVVFHVKDAKPDSPKPSGRVAADGSFRLSTYPHGEGAPAGEYVVAVTWYPRKEQEAANPKSKFPERHTDPSGSPLRATVKDGPTELEPFRIAKD